MRGASGTPRGLPRHALETLCMAVEAAEQGAGVEVEEVIVFGSYARGDWLTTSDLDLILVSRGWRGRIIDRPDPIYRLLARKRPPVWPQILCYKPEELEELTASPTSLADASNYWLRISRKQLEKLCGRNSST